MSFESAYIINGVNVNENIRGQATTPYIEDAIQETTVATAGVSAEFGRFTGGVVNVVTKSGGNIFSGIFRNSLNNDNWRSYVTGNDIHPFRVGNVATGALIDCETCGLNGAPSKVDLNVPQYRYTFGGPIIRDHHVVLHGGPLRGPAVLYADHRPRQHPVHAGHQHKAVRDQADALGDVQPPVRGGVPREDDRVNANIGTATTMDLASNYTTTQPTSSSR